MTSFDLPLFGIIFGTIFGILTATIFMLRSILTSPRSSSRSQASSGKPATTSLFGMAVEKMPYAVYIKDLSNQSLILYWNKAAEDIFGIPKEAVLGKKASDLFPIESAEFDMDMDKRSFERSEIVENIEYTFLTHARGELILTSRRFTLGDDKGQPRYVLTITEDVTLRKKIEEEIRKGEESFRYMVLAAPVMMWMSDAEGHFVYVNRFWAEYTGRSRETEMGDGWMGAVYPEDREKISQRYKEACQTKKNFKIEYRMKQKDGDYRWVLNTGASRMSEEGSFAGFTGYCVDIHERKILEAQLMQSQKMETVGTLAGGIAHDLNNQLTPLSGYIDLILKDTDPADPKRELLEEATQAAKRCAEVVQRLMGFSRPSTQTKEWIKPSGILDELKKLFPKFLPSTIQTEIVCDAEIWPVMGNETELQTVLMNLAANARDAMTEGGRLSVAAKNVALDADKVRDGHKAGFYVHVAVADSGKGMTPDVVHKIFEPFFTTKKKGQGTGLGLAMVFRVLKDHGGWVDVESTPGRGTTFHIYLPADPKAALASTQASAQASSPASIAALPKGDETILFVDDEEPLRNLGKVFLERLGYTPILSVDGEEAVGIYQEKFSRIGAVVMDMTMPKLTGAQTLKKILEINPSAKVIVASGFTAEGTPDEIMGMGAAGYLTKPYTIHMLALVLRKALDKSVV